MSTYLFNMAGDPIAFRRTWTDSCIFDLNGRWIGWFPWDGHDAVDRAGHYLGTVVGDRLVRRNDWYERPSATAPVEPGTVQPTGQPSTPHAFPNCFAYEDVKVRLLT